jgi:hypothetical protein
MSNVHRIPKEKIDSYVRRQANRNIRIILITFGFFVCLLVGFFPSWEFIKTFVLPFMLFLSFINLIIYIASLNQIENWAKKMYFYWDDNKIMKQVAQEDLNFANQFAMSRSESRYGSKFNQEMKIIHLDSTKITDKEIIFTSYDYNLLTGNGRIRVPYELEQFNTLKAHILKNASKYKLVIKN